MGHASVIRVVLADDHPITRRHLRAQLESDSTCEVCGEAESAEQAIALVLALKPDVAVLDLSMPGMSGIEATRQIRVSHPMTEVVIVTMHDHLDLARSAVAAGARGYVLKSEVVEHLVPAVLALAQNRPYFVGRFAPAWSGK